MADASSGDVSGISATLWPGDVNNDNRVNIIDLGMLADAFNSTGFDLITGLPSINWNPDADLDGDLKVSIVDLGILASKFNAHGDP